MAIRIRFPQGMTVGKEVAFYDRAEERQAIEQDIALGVDQYEEESAIDLQAEAEAMRYELLGVDKNSLVELFGEAVYYAQYAELYAEERFDLMLKQLRL